MTDYISRADAIDAVRSAIRKEWLLREAIVTDIEALPSVELPKGDLISRADVLKYPIRLDHYDEVNGSREFVYGVESVIEYVESLPSADAVEVDRTSEWVAVRREEYEDLIADAVQGEWIRCEAEITDWGGNIVGYSYWYECDQCGSIPPRNEFKQEWLSNFCPNCGVRMKDRIKQCDIVDSCEECPRYGDDCDGDKI